MQDQSTKAISDKDVVLPTFHDMIVTWQDESRVHDVGLDRKARDRKDGGRSVPLCVATAAAAASAVSAFFLFRSCDRAICSGVRAKFFEGICGCA